MTTTWRPHRRPPLGLPPGSVRALIALAVVAVVIVQAARGRAPETLWSETLMIVLAHYFTSRRFVELPGEVQQQLEETGVLQREPRPLYLPRHSIRAVIVLSFVGLAVYLYRKDVSRFAEAMKTIGLVFAYFVGIVVRAGVDWWSRRFGRGPRWWWGDVKAIVVLLAVGACACFYFADRPDLVPQWQRNAVLALALFYFGSR